MRIARLSLSFALAAIPACAMVDTEESRSQAIANLAPGESCRVTLRPESGPLKGESQVIYEGTVRTVSASDVTLDATSMEAWSRSGPPVATNLPFIDRHFGSTAVVRQTIDQTIPIPINRIESVRPAEDERTVPTSQGTSEATRAE